ncbi:ac29 [Hemileuca sp. nucleopolyhedrovirus]|uniref:Ac29 n=1 Tax=Hemileuca sp. nucleopolyhedrovirus TaxID=1367203 RepID=S5MQ24_9ABAC|nr:ac29 [Hemileuca sp. nucleopolyhedrovirus]AGR56773.1 ac29 [Hemileuca sp. nucleopolyhedrovirus]
MYSNITGNKYTNYREEFGIRNSNKDVSRQYMNVLRAKEDLKIKSAHQERLKNITKNPNEIVKIENKLQQMRKDFLDFAVNNF